MPGGEWATRRSDLGAWGMPVPRGNLQKPWQVLGNFDSPRRGGGRARAKRGSITHGVGSTRWALCLLNLLSSLFASGKQQCHVSGSYRVPNAPSGFSPHPRPPPPPLTLCGRCHYNSILQRRKWRLREIRGPDRDLVWAAGISECGSVR